MSVQQQITMSEVKIRPKADAPGARAQELGKERWERFLSNLTVVQIKLAEKFLRDCLGVERLDGKSFLDIGGGSGLFSLAARRLGARVYSFDNEPHAVACANELRRRYFPDDRRWTIREGSVLDRDFVRGLGTFDVVYCWDVLHQTGAMFEALQNVKALVSIDGRLLVAVYNDQGQISERWIAIKKRFNSLPKPFATLFALARIARLELPAFLFNYRNGTLKSWIRGWIEFEEISLRGTSRWRDWIDWFHAYPYERASIDQIVDICAKDGFKLTKLHDAGEGFGCNEFTFHRIATAGKFVESRIQNGRSMARRFGHRVMAPFALVEGQWVGTVREQPYVRPGAKLFLLQENEIIGPAEITSRGEVVVGYEDQKANDLERSKLYLLAAFEQELLPPFGHCGGKMWEKSIPDLISYSDQEGGENPSCAYVFESGMQLPFPHAVHTDIQRQGQGRFSHWRSAVYFSTLDGRNPNRSDRIYRVLVASQPIPADQSVAKLFGVPLRAAGKTPEGWKAVAEKLPATSHDATYFLFRDDKLIGATVLDESGSVVVAEADQTEESVRQSEYRLVLGKVLPLAGPFHHDDGFMWSKWMPNLADIADQPDHYSVSPVFLFQDNHQLAPPHSRHKDIAELGAGRFSHWQQSIFFSSHDSSDPNSNGSTYSIFAPFTPRTIAPVAIQEAVTESKNEAVDSPSSRPAGVLVKSRIKLSDLIHLMHDRFGAEVPPTIESVRQHVRTYFDEGLIEGSVDRMTESGTTPFEDCALLYLLIRYFECKSCFEIGTFIGTTAVVMNEAAKRNGGVVTTCDPLDYHNIPPWSGIRFIRERSKVALSILESEYKTVDFCFMDWVPDDQTMNLVNKVFSPDAIIAVHDYHPGDPKGEVIVNVLISKYNRITDGEWFLPDQQPTTASDGSAINKWTAFFVPASRIKSLPL